MSRGVSEQGIAGVAFGTFPIVVHLQIFAKCGVCGRILVADLLPAKPQANLPRSFALWADPSPEGIGTQTVKAIWLGRTLTMDEERSPFEEVGHVFLGGAIARQNTSPTGVNGQNESRRSQ